MLTDVGSFQLKSNMNINRITVQTYSAVLRGSLRGLKRMCHPKTALVKKVYVMKVESVATGRLSMFYDNPQ